MAETWRQTINGFVMKMLAVMVISAILQLVGLVTPGWMILIISTVKVHMGLFYAKVCVSGTCSTKTYEEIVSQTGVNTGINGMREFQAEAVLGLLLCVITIVILFVTRRRMQTEGNRTGLIISCITAALSAILSLVAAGQFANSTLKTHNLLEKFTPGKSPFGFPYSVLLTGLGGILAGLCVIVMLVKVLSWKESDAQPVQAPQQNAQVYSAGTQPNTVYYQPNQGGPYVYGKA